MIISSLITDYNNGMLISSIREKHNISKAGLYKILELQNIPRDRRSTIEKRRKIKLNSSKKVFIMRKGISLIFLLSIILTGCFPNNNDLEKSYCGPVEEIGKEEPTSGYKSSNDAIYYLIIKDQQCGKKIRINVTVPTYYDAYKGKHLCFDLSGYDLHRYGNTTGYEHLK